MLNGKANAQHASNGIPLLKRSYKSQKKIAGKLTQVTSKKASKPLRINEIDMSQESRFSMQDAEFNRVLGGGLVAGSLTLLGGEPGIGKSTLLLQVALKLKHKILYVSGEESQKQIKMRAERINPNSQHCYILTETNTQRIFKQIESIEPDIVVIDSIQTLHSEYIESFSREYFADKRMHYGAH